MNIGIDIRNVGKNRTGDETVFFHLARWLPKLDPENTYFLLIDNRSKDDVRKLKEMLNPARRENVKLEMCGSGNKFVWNGVGAYLAAKRLKLDVYHTQYITPLFLPKRTKLVTHVHDVSFAAYPEYIGWKDRVLLEVLMPLSLRHADGIVAVSEFSGQEITKYYDVDSSKISVAPNGIAVEEFGNQAGAEIPADIRERYHLPESFLLHIGTHQPRKNIPFLLRGFARMRESVPEAKLVLTGEPRGYHYDKTIDQMIREHHLDGAVVFAGYVEREHLPVVIGAASAVVSVSRYEGFGLPLLEGMATGVPVVASDISAYREVAKDAALLVPIDNLAKLEHSLYSVWSDTALRATLSERGRGRASLFSWKRSAQSVLEVYQRICL